MTTLEQQKPSGPGHPAEKVSERGGRSVEEAAIKVAFADVAAGRVVPDDELDGWLDDWVSGRDVRVPTGSL